MAEKQGHYEKHGDVEEWVWDDTPAPPEPEKDESEKDAPAPPEPEKDESEKDAPAPAPKKPAAKQGSAKTAKK